MPDVHILFENEAWLPPLRAALAARGLTVQEHFTAGGVLDLAAEIPHGVWINRMSPSSHTRGHQSGVTFTREWLGLLEAAGRTVINGTRAFTLELSKLQQDAAFRAAGIRTPHTLGVIASDAKEAARKLTPPFITKHNQGGKGLGVQLFRDHASFDTFVDQGGLADGSPDGVVVLQQYIQPAQPFITRIEIVDGAFQYALQSSTEGGFELCPSDACALDDQFCPVGDSGKFTIRTDITADDPLVKQYVALMKAHDVRVAGIEFVEDAEGNRYTYDLNGTTNYNQAAESTKGLDGMDAIAALVERELRALATRAAA